MAHGQKCHNVDKPKIGEWTWPIMQWLYSLTQSTHLAKITLDSDIGTIKWHVDPMSMGGNDASLMIVI
jgi:hypothetical protein